MSSGSVRLHVPIHLHQHDSPAGADGTSARPSDPCAAGDSAGGMPARGRLWREDGRVMYQDAGGSAPEAVRLAWARPLSGRDGPVSVLLAGKKREAAYLPSLDVLSPESRTIAREELAAGMVLPRITGILRVRPRFGSYYWDVETDMGRRTFLLSSPENNSLRPRPDALVVRDVSGNCYEISPVSGLDVNSRKELDRVL